MYYEDGLSLQKSRHDIYGGTVRPNEPNIQRFMNKFKEADTVEVRNIANAGQSAAEKPSASVSRRSRVLDSMFYAFPSF